MADDPVQATGPKDPDGPGDPLFDYTERFSAVLVAAGFPPMPARVFVALLVADSGRLTAAELAAMLRISPAAVSGAVRYLIQLGLVHKERVPGSRRNHYRMPGGMWDSMIRQRDQVMTRWTALVREGIDLVGRDTPAGERLAEQASFLEFVSKELSDVLSRWERHRASLSGQPDGLAGVRYLVRKRLFSTTDDQWVTDERGDRVFVVDGKDGAGSEHYDLGSDRQVVVVVAGTADVQVDAAV